MATTFESRVAGDSNMGRVNTFGSGSGLMFSCPPRHDAHGHAARRLGALADRFAEGRVLAMGGGGYNRTNLATAWTRVVEELAA